MQVKPGAVPSTHWVHGEWWPLFLLSPTEGAHAKILYATLSHLAHTQPIKTWVQVLSATDLLNDLGNFAYPLWSSVSSFEMA